MEKKIMETRIAVLVALLVVSGTATPGAAPPKDVQVFIKNAEACDHFAGEFDSGLSEKRQREIEQSVVRYCRSAQKQLRQLSEKYKHDPKIAEIILSNANDSVTSFR